MEPLRYPDESELSIRRGWFNAIPMVGLSIESQLRAQILRHVQLQLDTRGAIPESEWHVAKINWQLKCQIDSILRRDIGWANAWFHPADPFHILMAAKFGDLCEVLVVMDIERLIGHKWPDTWTKAILADMTYAELLQELKLEIAQRDNADAVA